METTTEITGNFNEAIADKLGRMFPGGSVSKKEKSDEQNNPIIFFCFISPQKARPWLTLHTHLELVSA